MPCKSPLPRLAQVCQNLAQIFSKGTFRKEMKLKEIKVCISKKPQSSGDHFQNKVFQWTKKALFYFVVEIFWSYFRSFWNPAAAFSLLVGERNYDSRNERPLVNKGDVCVSESDGEREREREREKERVNSRFVVFLFQQDSGCSTAAECMVRNHEVMGLGSLSVLQKLTIIICAAWSKTGWTWTEWDLKFKDVLFFLHQFSNDFVSLYLKNESLPGFEFVFTNSCLWWFLIYVVLQQMTWRIIFMTWISGKCITQQGLMWSGTYGLAKKCALRRLRSTKTLDTYNKK